MALAFVEGFSSTLTKDLSVSSAQMVLASVEGLAEAVANGDHTYLALDNGLTYESVRVLSVSGKTVIIDRGAVPQVFYIGTCASFKIGKDVLNEVMGTTDTPTAAAAEAYTAGSGIRVQNKKISLDACSLNSLSGAIGSSVVVCFQGTNYLVPMDVLANALQGNLQLGSSAISSSGVKSVSSGAGIKLSGTAEHPAVALDTIHNGLVAGNIQVDAYGRVIELNNRTDNLQTDGRFVNATVTVVNGDVTIVEEGDQPITQLIGVDIRTTETTVPGRWTLEMTPGPLADVIDGDWKFDSRGFLTSYPGTIATTTTTDTGGDTGGSTGGGTDTTGAAAIIGRAKITIAANGESLSVAQNSQLTVSIVGDNVRCVLGTTPSNANYSALIWADFIPASTKPTYNNSDEVQKRGVWILTGNAYTNAQSTTQFTFAVKQGTISFHNDVGTYKWNYEASTVNIVVFS